MTTLSDVANEVGAFAREIVAKRVAITTGAGAVVAFTVSQGWVPDNVAQNIDHGLGIALTAVAAVVGALWARKDTTVADLNKGPIAKDGTPMMSVDVAAQALLDSARDAVAVDPDDYIPISDDATGLVTVDADPTAAGTDAQVIDPATVVQRPTTPAH